MKLRIHPIFKLAIVCGGFLAILYTFASLFRPDLPPTAPDHDREREEMAERMRDVRFSDEDRLASVVYREVDYSEGAAAPWFPRGEASYLSELVEAGRIDPVAERTGPEPLVLEGVEGLGRYGGTWIRTSTNHGDRNIISNRMSGATLVRWSPLGDPVVPHVAKGWEHNDDYTEWRFFLRKGMRWSDGHPFTAHDIVYHWEEEVLALNVSNATWMRIHGEEGEIIAEDDHTVVFRFPHPHPLLKRYLTSVTIFASPRHFLLPYHPQYGDPAFIAREMDRRREHSPRSLYQSMREIQNPEHPRLWPWILRTHTDSAPYPYVRNPYYFAVDSAGNQLPYIDRVVFQVRRGELIPIAAAEGGISMQARFVRYEDYTLLMEERDRGGYDILHWFPATRSTWALFPNINRRADDRDPFAAQKQEIITDKRFRQALSLAINRRDIIDALYSGVGEPSQLAPGEASFFHSPELQYAFVEHDPARASRLLDEIGLTGYDSEGYRTFHDGSRMTWYIEFSDFSGMGPSQFIVDDWAEVGVRAIPRERAGGLFYTRKLALQHDITVWSGESEFDPLMEPRSFVPTYGESHHAIAYGIWFQDGGLFGAPEADEKGGVAPSPGSDIRRAMELLAEAQATSDRYEQKRIFDEIFALNARNVWTIGIASPPPQPVIKRRDFRNVPENALFGWTYRTPANAGLETYFFEDPVTTQSVHERLKYEMMHVTVAPDISEAPATAGQIVAMLVRYLLIGIVLLAVVLSALRHPYIARRLAWMIPTLTVISIVAFAIIQIPPGSYIDSWIMQQMMSGDEAALEEVEYIRELFHLEEPVIWRYAHWMGLKWFVSFDGDDRGLLQGQLGRAMTTRRPVNEMIGERLLLTVCISAGTILFTWMVAFPIGVYSAVRQYSIGDYFFTFVGFIGLCIPNFLLALLLMYAAQEYLGISVAGLFSPEYAIQEHWDAGKVADLLKHIWVPILVLGTAGTAGMIRVMRANLLDELRRPYVTTARAKGVRPFKLLMKYPVRLALNPFISGIGGIFPALISGGAIVAIVLSLPTVGPLLLDGLLTQDMYLAGSLLMVLSLLSVFGTLVSDLLLLMLDPRIRLEGGSTR